METLEIQVNTASNFAMLIEVIANSTTPADKRWAREELMKYARRFDILMGKHDVD